MIEESSEAVNRLCCRCLVLLVFNGHAELGYVLSGLLNALPSARSLICSDFQVKESNEYQKFMLKVLLILIGFWNLFHHLGVEANLQ